MLIINADDFGKNRTSTDRIIEAFERDRITSTSAMVFMVDSERAARLALEKELETGLHLNFTLRFDGTERNDKLIESQNRTAVFLSRSPYCVLIYNPFLRRNFEYLYKAQYEEFLRLYGKTPSHIDGHQHFHLALNVILDSFIPIGSKVRRNFTFGVHEKTAFNRLYRRMADRWIKWRYEITDHFFDVSPIKTERMDEILAYARRATVELMVHPERPSEYSYLMSDEFLQAISRVKKGGYSHMEKSRLVH